MELAFKIAASSSVWGVIALAALMACRGAMPRKQYMASKVADWLAACFMLGLSTASLAGAIGLTLKIWSE
jgi:hypothetical protein